jgi:hypothetical protein
MKKLIGLLILGALVFWASFSFSKSVKADDYLYIPDMSSRWPMLRVAQVVQGGEPTEYPDGQYCTPNGDNFKGLQTPDNPCSCHIVMKMDKDKCCEQIQANDAVCKQFCHEHHCSCPHECVNPDGSPIQ